MSDTWTIYSTRGHEIRVQADGAPITEADVNGDSVMRFYREGGNLVARVELRDCFAVVKS